MDHIQNMLNYIVALGPSLVAVASLIASLIYTFRKTGTIKESTVKEVKTLADKIYEDNTLVANENRKLRDDNKALRLQLAETNAKLDKILEKTDFVRK